MRISDWSSDVCSSDLVLVDDTVGLLRRTLGEQLEIAMVLAPDLWPVLADPVQLESAFANLAINARDATPQGGKLAIETVNKQLDSDYAALNLDGVPGEYVMLGVSDNGTGISPDILDKVYEPFLTTTSQGHGT